MNMIRENLSQNPRSNNIDYSAVSKLHYLGNYVRILPVSLVRMMENAYDWEHLPFVHPSSFAGIALIESGSWGWRAKTSLPPAGSDNTQIIELLVDAPNHYWATTVLAGQGEGVQIHTQATGLGENNIEIDVKFYLPQAPESAAQSDMILGYLQAQYGQLYDEDLALMEGRQSALDQKQELRTASSIKVEQPIAKIADLDIDQSYSAELGGDIFTVRYWQKQWIVHSAVCPHRLGPLGAAEVDAEGIITCPWHGYGFDILTGQNVDGKCSSLNKAPKLVERDGWLYLQPRPN